VCSRLQYCCLSRVSCGEDSQQALLRPGHLPFGWACVCQCQPGVLMSPGRLHFHCCSCHCWTGAVPSCCVIQVIAQSNTFILAGYETTANTLSYCVYNIAAHPKVQERLLQEIDAYGRHRRVAFADLGEVGCRPDAGQACHI